MGIKKGETVSLLFLRTLKGSVDSIDRVPVEEFGRHLERVTSAPNSTAREKNPSGWKSNTRDAYQVGMNRV